MPGIDELQKYLDNKTGYGRHISDLVIYDKPKDLDDFMVFAKRLATKRIVRNAYIWALTVYVMLRT